MARLRFEISGRLVQASAVVALLSGASRPAAAQSEVEPTADSEEEGEENTDSTSEEKSAKEDPLELEQDLDREPPPTAEKKAAVPSKAPEEQPEDDKSWLAWPFDSRNRSVEEDLSPSRFAAIGPLVGWVHRPSGSSEIRYRPGVAYGGYLRAEFFPWLGVRLHYREERIPVEVEPGAFDYEGDSTGLGFAQENLRVVNLGMSAEPTWVIHPRFRLHANLGWTWLRFTAATPNEPGGKLPGERAAVETNFLLGGGVAVDIIKNWWEFRVDYNYGITGNQTGSAYEPAQIVVDGAIHHIAPLPHLQNPSEIIFSTGIIL